MFRCLSYREHITCGAGGQKPGTGVTTLICANMTEGGIDRGAVDQFNRTHSDVQIEVRDYFDADGKTGWERLLTEIGAGNVPDILDMRGMPYMALAEKGYLENLWPYIENDPELGREGVLEAPLRAAEVNGGLYVIFNEVYINTLVGAESVVGNRYSWSLEELLEAFSAMPEDSTIFEYVYSRKDIFYYLMRMRLESYIDRKTGQCTFDGADFRSTLEFINSFPEESAWTDQDADEINREITKRILSGRQLLHFEVFARLVDIQWLDTSFGLGGRAAFIGFPTEDGSAGSSFYLPYGTRELAMSSACREKEAAWEFLRQILLPRYTDLSDNMLYERHVSALSINREDYERMIRFDMTQKNAVKQVRFLYGNEQAPVSCRAATQEELTRYEDFINSIDKIEFFDNTVYDIVEESASPYFAGDKTLDETIQLIQNRVTLYVNENR